MVFQDGVCTFSMGDSSCPTRRGSGEEARRRPTEAMISADNERICSFSAATTASRAAISVIAVRHANDVKLKVGLSQAGLSYPKTRKEIKEGAWRKFS
jgi:hypothetical protein